MIESAADRAQRQHATAHLLIDIVNPFDFDGAADLFPHALAAAQRIAALKRRLSAADVPTVYVNDNFGHWELGFRELVELFRTTRPQSAALLQHVAPVEGDHFILKPKHSGFFATSLEILLGRWQTRHLILTGIAGNICVMFTANDAHMRDYRLLVPTDCIASEDEADNQWALRQMQRVMNADVRPSQKIATTDLADQTDGVAGLNRRIW
jgi:nicotinamidase-related amidase